MEKLRLDRQGLSRLAQKRIGELPMSTEDAHYTIAHEHGIRLSKYLSPEQVAATRHLVTQLRASAAPQPAKPPRSTAGPKSGPRRQTLVTIGGVDVERVPGLTAQHAADAKRMAESVYPMLYVFENSARDVIQGVLEARYGSEWWLQGAGSRSKGSLARLATAPRD